MEEMANIVPTAVFVMGQPSAQTDRVSDAVLSLCRQPESRAWTDAAVSPETRTTAARRKEQSARACEREHWSRTSRDAHSQGSRGAEPW
jgi:5-deoxy-D-glucuronate isomerase